MIRRLPRRSISSFVTPDGEVRELKSPISPATGRQLARLNRAGLVALVEAGQVEPVLMGEAAAAIDSLAPEAPLELPDDEPVVAPPRRYRGGGWA